MLLIFDMHHSIYSAKRVLMNLETTYVYTGNECVLDEWVKLEKLPPCYYSDQATEETATADCVFVIWQLASRHVIANLRESLSILKYGHHLGQKGTCWIFKAKNKKERDDWMSVLHK